MNIACSPFLVQPGRYVQMVEQNSHVVLFFTFLILNGSRFLEWSILCLLLNHVCGPSVPDPKSCVLCQTEGGPTSLAHGTLHLLTTAFSRLPGPLTPELVYIQVISISQRVIWGIVPMWCSSIFKATAVRGIGRNAGAPLLTGCSRNIRRGY